MRSQKPEACNIAMGTFDENGHSVFLSFLKEGKPEGKGEFVAIGSPPENRSSLELRKKHFVFFTCP